MQTEQAANNVVSLPFGVKTKNGLDVVIFFGEASESYPLLGMYKTEGQWYPWRWTREGKAFVNIEDGHPLDLQFTVAANTDNLEHPTEAA